jgi:hypothetical protein
MQYGPATPLRPRGSGGTGPYPLLELLPVTIAMGVEFRLGSGPWHS